MTLQTCWFLTFPQQADVRSTLSSRELHSTADHLQNVAKLFTRSSQKVNDYWMEKPAGCNSIKECSVICVNSSFGESKLDGVAYIGD
jgi:hypothetical protein